MKIKYPYTKPQYPTSFNSNSLYETVEQNRINMRRVCHANRERLLFWKHDSILYCNCIYSNCWDHFPKPVAIFSTFSTYIILRYFLDFALLSKRKRHRDVITRYILDDPLDSQSYDQCHVISHTSENISHVTKCSSWVYSSEKFYSTFSEKVTFRYFVLTLLSIHMCNEMIQFNYNLSLIHVLQLNFCIYMCFSIWRWGKYKEKRKISDAVLWQKPLSQQKIPKSKVTIPKRHQILSVGEKDQVPYVFKLFNFQVDLVCDEKYKASLAKTVFFAGVFVGSFGFGLLSDLYVLHVLSSLSNILFAGILILQSINICMWRLTIF